MSMPLPAVKPLFLLGIGLATACSSAADSANLVDAASPSNDVLDALRSDASHAGADPADGSSRGEVESGDAPSTLGDTHAQTGADTPLLDSDGELVPLADAAQDTLADMDSMNVPEPADSFEPDTKSGTGFFDMCFVDKQDPAQPSPDYDQFVFTAADHCKGTNHQIIKGVERVVFLGDSVTVGTPNGEHLLSVDNGHFYRNLLAEWLASEFELDKGDPFVSWNAWKSYDYQSGTGAQKISGDFANCAKWGGRCDDLEEQSKSCFKGNDQAKRTLTVFTVGGNDVAKLTQVGGDASDEEVAAGYPEAWQVAKDAIADLEASVKWLKDPANFPKGNYVVFGTPFEFTDGTGKVDSCTPETKLKIPGIGVIDLTQLNLNVAAIAGYKEWKDTSVQRAIVVWMLEEFLRIATTYKADMIWMAESFCGHGYVASGPNPDPNNACYEGPDAELWFDETCTHPSPAGHAALFKMFRKVIEY